MDHSRQAEIEAAGKPENHPRRQTASAGLACVGCGYDLTGVAVGQDCPECGAAMSDTLSASRGMTRRQAVAVVLRLGALVIVFLSLTVIDFLLWIMLAFSGLSPAVTWDPDMVWYVVIQSIPLAIRIAIAVFVWSFAPRLAGRLVRHDGALLESGRLGPSGLLSVGLILFGVYAVVRGFAAGLSILLSESVTGFYGSSPYGIALSETSLWTSAVWLATGLVLIVSPRLRLWLGRDLRRA